jgi:arsenite-transporting ATPase
LAAARAGRHALVVSTDPAASLGDAFARPLGPEPLAIPVPHGRLHAVEIDAPAALARWLRTRRRGLEEIALRGTWLDREDVSRLLRLSIPGIDELAALLEIERLAFRGAYDLVVVDTAPTGHTLRMLGSPDTLRNLAGVFEGMQAKHRALVEALRGRWRPDAQDGLITEIDEAGRRLASLLRDRARVRLSWVMLPELMVVEETADAAAALSAAGLSLSDIIVNRVTPGPDRPCAWCDSRRVLEARSIAAARRRLPPIPLIEVRSREVEPTGLRHLAGIGAEIASAVPFDRARARRLTTPSRFRSSRGARLEPVLVAGDTRLLLFGGKGGVGKTTCAAAAAVSIARSSTARNVLLLSTDPAHSLSDALGAPVSATAAPIRGGPPNLLVREIDAAAEFLEVRRRYADAIDVWFDRLSRGGPGLKVDAAHDRRVMHGLIDLAPPGIDELTAVMEVTDALLDGSGNEPDLVVMDTAPTGHALRLLEMPALAQGWARALMSILLKYQPVTGVGELGAVLLRMSQGLGRLRSLLTDPRRASFIVVTRAAALPREETRRLVARLAAMQVHVPWILVNAVGRGTCARCRAAALHERRELQRLQRLASGASQGRVPLAIAPAEIPPPHGVRELQRWKSTWRRWPPQQPPRS